MGGISSLERGFSRVAAKATWQRGLLVEVDADNKIYRFIVEEVIPSQGKGLFVNGDKYVYYCANPPLKITMRQIMDEKIGGSRTKPTQHLQKTSKLSHNKKNPGEMSDKNISNTSDKSFDKSFDKEIVVFDEAIPNFAKGTKFTVRRCECEIPNLTKIGGVEYYDNIAEDQTE